MKKLMLIGTAALAVAACQPKHLAVVRPDPSHLRCQDEPAVPAGQTAEGDITDEQDANYKLALRGAWYDCHSQVKYLKDWFAKLPR